MNNIDINSDKTQRLICYTLCMLVSVEPLARFIDALFGGGEGFIFDTLLCYGALLVFVLISATRVFKDIKMDIVITTIFLISVWIIVYCFREECRRYMFSTYTDILANPFYILFAYAFSGYVFVRYLTDLDIFEKVFTSFSIIVVLTSIATFFINLNNEQQMEYMTFSYNMLLHTTFITLMFFRKKNPVYLLVSISGTLIMIMAGCRGAIVSFIASLLINLLFVKTTSVKKVFIILLSIALFVVFIVNFEKILDWLADVSEYFGISSRTLRLIKDGEFLFENGRDTIREQLIKDINALGHGFYADRVLARGSYAHNLIVEVLINFGAAFGTLILLGIFVLIMRGILAENEHLRLFVIVFLSAGFFKLFFSSSYLRQEPAFYILLGFCVNALRDARRRRRLSDEFNGDIQKKY